MTSKFDWNNFEESGEPSGSFEWDQFTEASSQENGINFPSLGKNKKVRGPSSISNMQQELGKKAKVVGSSVLGIPGDIAKTISSVPAYLLEKITGMENPEEISSFLRMMSPLGGLPTTSELVEKTEELVPSLAPKDEKEREQEENLSLLTSLLVPFPSGKANAAKKFTDPKTLDKLYQAGKSMGLNAKQLAPLFQGESKVNFLGKFAKQSPKLKKTFQSTEDVLSGVYSNISEKASKLPKVSEKSLDNLIDKFTDIKINLQKTLKASPEKQSAIHFIEEAIEKANNFGASPEDLINFYHDINSSVNWKAVKGGKKVLASLKKPTMEALKEADPKLAESFSNTNILYSKLKNIQKEIGLPKFEKYIEFGKWAGLLTSLAFGDPQSIASAGAAIVLPKIATKLLTDPKWQSLHKRIIHSIKTENASLGFKAFQALKEKIKKEEPESYEEIDWNEF
jgi:hypothetical protein